MTLALDIPMPSRCAVRLISAAVSPDEQPGSLSAQRGSPREWPPARARLHSAAASGLLTLSNALRSAATPKRAATNAADAIDQCDGERAHLDREGFASQHRVRNRGGSQIDEQGNASGSRKRARAVPVQIIAVAAASQFCNFQAWMALLTRPYENPNSVPGSRKGRKTSCYCFRRIWQREDDN
jgi:hypothetical protein